MHVSKMLFRLLFFIFVMSHFFPLLFFVSSSAGGFYMVSSLSEGVAADTWATQAGIEYGVENNPLEKYTSSLYWAMMTLTTIGYGDIVATNIYERVYVILLMMVSALVFAYVVGTMCSLVQGLNSQALYFQSMIDDVSSFFFETRIQYHY